MKKQYSNNIFGQIEFMADKMIEDLEVLERNLAMQECEEEKCSWGFGFSDEEILALGLYPDDELYEMSLIAKILGK